MLIFRFPDVFISKEIVQSSDRSTLSVEVRGILFYSKNDMSTFYFNVFHICHQRVESHLAQALSVPTDKYSRIGSVLPSGRFMEDFVVSSKVLRSNNLTAVGFSLNPEHLPGDDDDDDDDDYNNYDHDNDDIDFLFITQVMLTGITSSAAA